MRKARELNADSSCQKNLIVAATGWRRRDVKGRQKMHKPVLKHMFILFCSGFLLSCASSGDSYESAGDPVQARGNDCFLQSSIRDYQVLDDSNLVVTGSGQRKYHVELMSRSNRLRSSWSIGFRSTTGMVCSGSGSVVLNDGFGSEGTSVRLRSVRQVTPDELEALLVQYGKKEPEEQQAPAQEEPEGAEVEELG
jgi:hypothetical protein